MMFATDMDLNPELEFYNNPASSLVGEGSIDDATAESAKGTTS